MNRRFHNAGGFLDDLFYTAQERKEDEMQREKMAMLQSLATQPASSGISPLLIVIPVVGVILGFTLYFVYHQRH